MLLLLVALSLTTSLASAGDTIASVFPPPEGYTRVDAPPFGQWLLQRPLRAAGEQVMTHAGRVVHHSRKPRVVDMPLVKGDLQQCADSAIRLRAEYLKETEQEAAISFHATSGDPIPWSRYQAGERAYAEGRGLKWRSASPASWDQYLSAVFTWAGTMSLQYDSSPASDPLPGDFLVMPGSPGHAVVLLDVAHKGSETTASEIMVLVGEGYMPAQDFHVEVGPEEGWWVWSEGLRLDHWVFDQDTLRRWSSP